MKTKYFTIAAVALTVAACLQEEDITPQGSQKDTPITIASAGVAELTTRSANSTTLVGTSATPATMSVFVTGGSKDKYNAANVQWQHDGEGWSSTTTMLYEGANSKQLIYACSPYTETTATDSTITVTAADQTDWLVATADSIKSSSVSLTMTHALAKLVLSVSRYGTEVTDQTISKVEVGNMYASGTLNIAKNTWSGLSETPADTLTMTNNELLVIPIASCASFPIAVTMQDGHTFKTTIDLTAESIGSKLAPGTQYTITLQVGQDKVTLGDITADKWIPTDGAQLATE